MGGLLDCPVRVGQSLQPAIKGPGQESPCRGASFGVQWMRILYRCWKDRQPYRQEIYLASLAKTRWPHWLKVCKCRESPLLGCGNNLRKTLDSLTQISFLRRHYP